MMIVNLNALKEECRMKMNNKELTASLEKFGLKASEQPETKQLLTKFSLNGYEYPMFIRQLTGGNLLQVLTFIPCTIEKDALFDLGRLLHMVNKELDMPGFCCDEESKTVFYRVVVPCVNGQVDETLFHAFLNVTKHVCEMFGTIIQAIAVKAMSLDEMMTKAKELQSSGKK
jgi:hypothetical protein